MKNVLINIPYLRFNLHNLKDFVEIITPCILYFESKYVTYHLFYAVPPLRPSILYLHQQPNANQIKTC